MSVDTLQEEQAGADITQARGEVTCAVAFMSAAVGRSHASLGFEVVGAPAAEFALACVGECAVPTVNADPRNVFMARVKNRPGARAPPAKRRPATPGPSVAAPPQPDHKPCMLRPCTEPRVHTAPPPPWLRARFFFDFGATASCCPGWRSQHGPMPLSGLMRCVEVDGRCRCG